MCFGSHVKLQHSMARGQISESVSCVLLCFEKGTQGGGTHPSALPLQGVNPPSTGVGRSWRTCVLDRSLCNQFCGFKYTHRFQTEMRVLVGPAIAWREVMNQADRVLCLIDCFTNAFNLVAASDEMFQHAFKRHAVSNGMF